MLPEIIQEAIKHCAEKDPAAHNLLVDKCDVIFDVREAQLSETSASIALKIHEAKTPKARATFELQYTAALERERNPIHPSRTAADNCISEAIKAACLAYFQVSRRCIQYLEDKLAEIEADETALAEKHGVPQAKIATSLREYVVIAKRNFEGWAMEARRSYGHVLFRTHVPSFVSVFARPRTTTLNAYDALGIDPRIIEMRNRFNRMTCEEQAKDAERLRLKNERIARIQKERVSRRAAVDRQHLPAVDNIGPIAEPVAISEETVNTVVAP